MRIWKIDGSYQKHIGWKMKPQRPLKFLIGNNDQNFNLSLHKCTEKCTRTIHIHMENHFIARLCGVGKLFPMHIWCLLLQQVQITMNLLRTSIPNPKLLDHGALEVMFDFNKRKLAPLGTKVIVHKKPG